ncbi:uncharacterized protein A1O9_02861 [Exophiala aquamarina CBS 119918]|uniref:Oxidoreductase n=1 Tax=Exophiala aquamarina CBS 119918 TaxID=1182545 RepID=A0A072PN66_9EURO|nr:uncharacterized protein A1O9_02861 [Exophiala aquamarina CBS 119918]KEF61296.1 hypothetical protein A1O9_02861 [Exophiala aquamarina CBS 119918]
MASYLITGANRGLGYGFIQVLARDSSNTVIGLVRDKTAADKQLAADGIKNVTFIQAAIADRKSLVAARDEVLKITGGRLDYLINNAAFIAETTQAGALDEFDDRQDQLEHDLVQSFYVNVVGIINTINVFLPLIKKSSVKKAVLISSGMADPDLVNGGIADSAPYTISKAAANMAIFKYNAKYKDQGVLFFAISPGIVATREGLEESTTVQKLKAAMPHWTGPLTPVQSAEMVLGVIYDSSLENGSGGAFVSHYGTKQWL